MTKLQVVSIEAVRCFSVPFTQMQFAHFYEYLVCSSDQSELFNYSLVRLVLCPLLDLCCADPFIIISPHRMHSTTMWSVATDVDLWSLCVCVCVCLSVCVSGCWSRIEMPLVMWARGSRKNHVLDGRPESSSP